MKTEVYHWRLTREVKADLEREARARRLPLSAILEAAVNGWLETSRAGATGEEVQRRLHAVAARSLGVLAGRNPRRAQNARERIRERLRRRHAR